MKRLFIILPLLCVCMAVAAQDSISTSDHHHGVDSTDVFFRHLKLNDLVVTGVTGDTKLKNSTAPISLVTARDLRATPATNVIDAIARQPGMAQLSTGGGISKPIIRGLGYNRVVVMSDGVRQEGQQWGDEHGIEVDGGAVHSVEVLKGPASLMYGSDAMAGVVILHSQPVMAEGERRGSVSAEYQTNNGLIGTSVNLAGRQQGFVWDGRFSGKWVHAYKNKYDGYVPGSQFREIAGRLMLGVQRQWGHSRLTGSVYQQTPSIVEGERDAAGNLLCASASPRSYHKQLPYQQVYHYKLVWDNSLNLSSGYLKAVIGYQQNRRQEFEEHHHHDHDEDEADDDHDHEAEDDHEAHEHSHDASEPALYFRLHTVTYDLRYLTHEMNGWKLSAGVQGMWQQSQNLGQEFLIPAYRLFDVGAYATASKQIDRWTLNGGLRYDHRHLHGNELMEGGAVRFTDFSRNFSGVTGSVGAVWNMSESLNLRLNVARGFRTPNMSELGSNGSHEGALRYELGNRQLKAEYSLQGDLGLDFTSRYVSAQVALFANHIDNFIFLRSNGQLSDDGDAVYAYTQGDARLLGFEAGVDFHPVHSLHFANTFSMVDARLKHQPSDRKYLPYTPAPKWTAELKWELLHHEHTTVGHRHETDHRHFTSDVTFNNLYVAAGLECYLKQNHVYSADDTERPTPSYTLLNLAAGTDLLIGHKKVAELYVAANNLLNRAYQSHLSRLKYADVNEATGRQGVYNMGRNVTFKLVVPFSL